MTYHSGEDIRSGDQILYAGAPGHVEFVVTKATGDQGIDWHLNENPRGGVMIFTERWGNFFLPDPELEEDLDLVSRT